MTVSDTARRRHRGDHAAAKKISDDQIPVIDLSPICAREIAAEFDNENLKSVSRDTQLALEAVGQRIHDAAINVGFFYVRGHGIDSEIIENALRESATFFDLTPQSKHSVLVNRHQRGWMPAGMATLEGSVTHDLKEVFFYGADVEANDPDLIAKVPLVAVNQWPDEAMAELRPAIEHYHRSLCEVGRRVLAAIAVGFGKPPHVLLQHYRKPLARGQLVYYPPSQADDELEQRFGVAPHTDFGVLTLLYQDDSGGLQVKTRADDWIEAPPIPGTIVCNTGDLLQRWTNNRFVSTVHRVINRSGKKRYSMPVFFDPTSQAIIDPIELGIEREQSLYEPISTGEHIQSRNHRNFTQYQE